MHHKNNYDNQLALIKGENINVGTKSELKDFFVLLIGVITVVLIFLSSFTFVSEIIIDKMSTETQLKIEKIFKIKETRKIPAKYIKKVIKIDEIKNKIIAEDKSLQGKSTFLVDVTIDRQINAMINTDGSLYITSALLDMNLTEEELAFVLAHEIGHYANKDHLKSISKQTAFIIFCLATGFDGNIGSVAQSVSEIENLSHSRHQEKRADMYANKMLIKIYGNNNGAKKFITRLKDNEKAPEFMHYFSSHPSWNERLALIEGKR